MKKMLPLVVFILLVAAAGALGAYATVPQIPGWYATLQKPDWTPPDAVFGPVWSTLYLMMAIAAWRVWQRLPRNEKLHHPAMLTFVAQLALNAAWSVIFFALHQIGWAAIDIIALLCAIAATISRFMQVDKTAAWLMAPYFAWVTFAACLNAAILAIN